MMTHAKDNTLMMTHAKDNTLMTTRITHDAPVCYLSHAKDNTLMMTRILSADWHVIVMA
jgi:hypothetical protein